MKARENFQHSIERAKHILELYELLHDTRQRDVRSDWAVSFRAIMHWPKSEKLVRVDGKGKDSILILKKSRGINRERFAHTYLSEVLRSALVTAVSSMDRYFHDVITDKSITLVNKKENEIPKELRNISIPILMAKKAIQCIKKNPRSRPGHIIKDAIQNYLHNQHTFQGKVQLEKAFNLFGI